jgi:hypothetical protein
VVNSTVSHGPEDLFHTRHLRLTLISTAVPGAERQYDSGRVLLRDWAGGSPPGRSSTEGEDR